MKFSYIVDQIESNTKTFILAVDVVISSAIGLELEVYVRRRIRKFVRYTTNFREESYSYLRSSRTNRRATKQDVFISAAHVAYHANLIMNSVIDEYEGNR